MLDNEDVSPGDKPGSRGQEAEKMRRLFILGVLLLAGCSSIRGPFQPRSPERVDDPRYSIPEQQCRARDQLPLPQESRQIAPPIPVAEYPYGTAGFHP